MHRTDSLATRIMTFIASTGGASTAEVVEAFPDDKASSVRATMGQLREFLARSKKVPGKWHTYTVNAKGRHAFGLKSGTKNGRRHEDVRGDEALEGNEDALRVVEPTITLPTIGLTLTATIARGLHGELAKVFG